jgi:hypothetical protein
MIFCYFNKRLTLLLDHRGVINPQQVRMTIVVIL